MNYYHHHQLTLNPRSSNELVPSKTGTTRLLSTLKSMVYPRKTPLVPGRCQRGKPLNPASIKTGLLKSLALTLPRMNNQIISSQDRAHDNPPRWTTHHSSGNGTTQTIAQKIPELAYKCDPFEPSLQGSTTLKYFPFLFCTYSNWKNPVQRRANTYTRTMLVIIKHYHKNPRPYAGRPT